MSTIKCTLDNLAKTLEKEVQKEVKQAKFAAMNDMASAYYESQTGAKASTLSALGSYKSLKAPQAKYMFDNDLETYYHSGQAQRTDDFLGVDMGVVRQVREIRIIQGRNSVDDVDYYDHCILEYSVDGQEWIALTEPLVGVYEIEWQGEPFEARYVGIRKLESEKRNWLAIRSFEINPVAESDFGWDANPFTSYRVEGSVVRELQMADSLELMLGEIDGRVEYRIFDDSTEYSRGVITSARTTIALPQSDVIAGKRHIEIIGDCVIYEMFYTDNE